MTYAASRATRRFDPTLVALVAFAAITPLVLLVAPAVASQLAVERGLDPAQIGTYFTVELGAFSFATIPSYYWLGRLNARVVAVAALAVFCAGNLVTALWMPDYPLFLGLRAIAAVGGGTLMVLCMTSAGESENRDRVYGLWVVGQLVAGTVGLAVLPRLFDHFGLPAFYVLLAALGALASPLCRGFDGDLGMRGKSAGVAGAATPRWLAALVICGMLAFYLSIGGIWTFVSGAAEAAGISAAATGTVLAVATTMGIVGAGLASWLGGRVSRRGMVILGYAILAASLALLAAVQGAGAYVIALCGFKFAWTFVLPFILAIVATHDATGRLVASLTLVIGVGLAVGPLIAGNMLNMGASLTTVILTGLVVVIASAAMMLRAEATPAAATLANDA